MLEYRTRFVRYSGYTAREVGMNWFGVKVYGELQTVKEERFPESKEGAKA